MRTVTAVLTVLLALPASAADQEVHEATPRDVLARQLHAGQLLPRPLPASAQVTPDGMNASEARAFTITARTNPERYDVSPSPFVVNQGDMVTITVRSANSQIHGFFLQRYFEQFITVTQQDTVLPAFVADMAGSFTYFCTIFCGPFHPMSATFVVNAVQNPAPTVSSFTPTSGPTTGGTNVSITGTNFVSGATVRFGNVSSNNVTFLSATSLTALSPAQAAGSVSIAVTNPDAHSGTSPTQFTYTSTAPTVSSFTPTSGPASGGTSVTITGTNFVSGATVRFGSVQSSNVTFNSATSLTALSPAQSAGSVSITVTNPDAHSGTSPTQFTYTSAAPAITSISPTSGPASGGTTVTIAGTNFQNGASVFFGNMGAASVSFVSATTLTAVTPPQAASSVNVLMTNPNGQSATSPMQFTYTTSGPTITSVNPNSGSTAGGTNITINGSGFQGGASVLIGSDAATNIVVTSSSTITARSPVGPSSIATSSARDVRVANPDGTSGVLPSGFTYVLPSPTIVSISPSSGAIIGGGAVTISGTGFTTALPVTVTFGGTAGTNVQVINAVTLSVIAPAHAAGAVDVVVQVGTNSVTSTGGFRYDSATRARRRATRH